MKPLIKKIIFLFVMIAVGVGASTGILFASVYATNAGTIETSFKSNFGVDYGFHDVSKTTKDSLPNLPATTVTMKYSNTGEGAQSVGLAYLEEFMKRKSSNLSDNEIINLKVSSDDKLHSYDFAYYATSPVDYVDGTFAKFIDVIEGSIEGNTFKRIIAESKPTSSGVRSMNVNGVLLATGASSADLQNSWNGLLVLVNSMPLDGAIYNMKISSPLDTGSNVEGSFYDKETFKNLSNVSLDVWMRLEMYGSELPFKSIGIAKATLSLDGKTGTNDSVIRLVMKGDQPDASGITQMINGLTAEVAKSEQTSIAWAGITEVSYKNSTAPVAFYYPSNFDWSY